MEYFYLFFKGNINGELNLNKEKDVYNGKSELTINDLKVNNQDLGLANLDIKASKDLKSFNLSFEILKNSFQNLSLNGKFNIEEGFIPLEMILKSENFDISPFSKLGKNVISDFQGLFNSSILISGTSNSPIFSGLIKTENVSFKIPYLNIQYDLKNNPSFVLEGQSFFINNFAVSIIF